MEGKFYQNNSLEWEFRNFIKAHLGDDVVLRSSRSVYGYRDYGQEGDDRQVPVASGSHEAAHPWIRDGYRLLAVFPGVLSDQS
ncbi:hypothetical protein ACSBR2_016248 [Camellia fascicularis]